MTLACFASAAPGIAHLTAAELTALGIPPGQVEDGGVAFDATPAQLCAANLELRTASRVIVRLAEFPARAFYELERKAKRVPWADFLAPGATAQFRVTSRKSKLYHEDAIAERLHTAARGPRAAGSGDLPAPSGDDAEEEPDSGTQLFIVRVVRDLVTISADSSGALLHRRGYRLAGAKAPLRETLAAAVLLGAGYDGTVALADPFCGSGTIPIEAALLARRIPPGLHRGFAFEQWPGFGRAGWEAIRARAAERVRPRAPAPIQGSDRDAGSVAAACANAERAGVAGDVRFDQMAVSNAAPPAGRGIIATNPPYGVRVAGGGDLRNLFATFGALVRERWQGWTVAMIEAADMPLREMRLAFETRWESSNGGIPIRLGVASP